MNLKNLEKMKELHRPEFNDLFTKNKMDFLENAWKHKLQTMEEYGNRKMKSPVPSAKRDSKIPGLNILNRRRTSIFNTEIIDIERIFMDENTNLDDLQHSSSCIDSEDRDPDFKKKEKKIKKDPKNHLDKSIVINKEALLN